ncbi:hypothetical protein BC828DRAFT_391315 [Blastocladiella britannica]|nr:hypothetical protein BC828DRAFT_391315 [Blastocladiella britannica]
MNPAEVTLPRSVFVSLKKAGFPKVKDTLLDFNAAMLAIDDCDIDNAVVLTANTIRRLFDKVLMDILAVTADMMRDCATEGATKRISKVVCVGGFCNNKYLVRSVRAMIDAKFPGVQVVVPANPGSAVLYGAALYGTSPSVVASRVLRYTYGFAATIVVDAETRFQGMDMSDWPIIVDEDMDRVIRGGFSRIAKKGQSMDANEVASIGVGASSANQTGVAIRVFLSDNENPVFVSEAGCKLLGVIEFDAPPRDSEGKMRLVVEFKFGSSEIAVTVKSRDGDFSRTAAISYE